VTHAVPFTTEAMQRYIKYARAIKPIITEQVRAARRRALSPPSYLHRPTPRFESHRTLLINLNLTPPTRHHHSRSTPPPPQPPTPPTQAQTALVRSYKRLRSEDAVPGSQSAYRITVRQLEALVRLSEATARVYCSKTVEVPHVAEATKLLQASILKIEQSDLELDGLAGAAIDEVTGEELPDEHCEQLLQGASLPRGKTDAQQRTDVSAGGEGGLFGLGDFVAGSSKCGGGW